MQSGRQWLNGIRVEPGTFEIYQSLQLPLPTIACILEYETDHWTGTSVSSAGHAAVIAQLLYSAWILTASCSAPSIHLSHSIPSLHNQPILLHALEQDLEEGRVVNTSIQKRPTSKGQFRQHINRHCEPIIKQVVLPDP